MNNARFNLSVLLFSVISLSGAPCHAQQLVNVERVDAALSSLVEDHGLVGVSGLVYEKGKEVYFGAYGYAEREADRPMRRDTLAYIYSMTKPIVGVALMTLYDQGAFKLDDALQYDSSSQELPRRDLLGRRIRSGSARVAMRMMVECIAT